MCYYIFIHCCVYIYIYMILCIIDVCNGQVGWYIQFLDGTYNVYIYIYLCTTYV